MISLARANLIHDWRRHAAAIIVLVLAGLLMTIQIGMMLGYMKSWGELKRQLSADIIVEGQSTDPQRPWQRQMINETQEGLLWMHPNIQQVEGWSRNGGRAQWKGSLQNDSSFSFALNIIDPTNGSMTWPTRFPQDLKQVMQFPGNVVLARSTAKNLGLKLGDTGYLGDINAVVAGIVEGFPVNDIQNSVFVSPQTARLSSNGRAFSPSLFLLKLQQPESAEQTVEELNQMLTPFGLEAKTVQQSANNEGFMQMLRGAGMMLLGSAGFALLIACGITSQTLRGAFLSQLKEFGSLRALGVKKRALVWIALEQAFWTGILSIPIAFVLAHLIRLFAAMFDMVIDLPFDMMMASSALLMLVAMFAGIVSLSAVFKAQPAELLR